MATTFNTFNTRAPRARRSTPLIGEVIPASASNPRAGFVARITRYASGRLLPAPRLLIDTTRDTPAPFASRLQALEALNRWSRR